MSSIFTVNGKPFFPLGGQVHNSSGYSLAALEPAFKALAALHANTVEIPVYWEQVEPVEGTFTFDHVDEILEAARARGLRVILLWFATWKNGSMQYAPAWVKSDPQRFNRVLTHSGKPLFVLSSHCRANWEGDSRAFNRLMRHLKETDGDDHTVIGIQVENEPGILGAVRDHSPRADEEFNARVPEVLVTAILASRANPIKDAWEVAGSRKTGSWTELLGPLAGEVFSAHSIATYIDRVAEAGKAVYSLPMVVNVWIAENSWRLPGADYPSGGAVTPMLDLWKWLTPHIDLIAPDIYVENPDLYRQVAAVYHRPDNPLFIPESGGTLSNSLNLFYAIADLHATGYAVFGTESLLNEAGTVKPSALPAVESFQFVAAVLPLIEKYHGARQVHSVIQGEFQDEQRFEFGDFLGRAVFNKCGVNFFTDYRHSLPDPAQRGRGLIFQTGPREFYLVGAGYRLLLQKKQPEPFAFSKPHDHFELGLTPYLLVEEGCFGQNGAWVPIRQRNGDEITGGLWMAPDTNVLHVLMTED